MKGTLVGHAAAIFGIDFDPDKGFVFTGSADKVCVFLRSSDNVIYGYLNLATAADFRGFFCCNSNNLLMY